MSGSLIIPGDSLPIDSRDSEIKTTIGPGIYKNPQTQSIIPTNAGVINVQQNKAKTTQLVYVESNSKRYIPQTNDFVIGIVTGVVGEAYKVLLQDFSTAVLLSMMAFPNATKKNRPNLKIGQAVYARVSQAIPEIETELECIDPTTGKEGGFGLLDESGYIFTVNLNFARELLFNPNSIFLEKLASRCKFEIAIGINGKVWIKCGEGIKLEKETSEEEGKTPRENTRDLKSTLAAARYLTKCQKISVESLDQVLDEAFKNV
ncbi:exosome complex exonuclease RRP40 [Scheffersomyces xylosifermentans]|uniref:exosome complex exonuclease RRP40 n=1 Tax=Scheffersomyces xylosifermentans TaxID=1304137 RepID=UPI00315C6BA7